MTLPSAPSLTLSGIPTIRVSGTSREIGLAHGRLAKERIDRSLVFYRDYFERSAKLPWPEALAIAGRFVPYLRSDHADLLAELEGVAEGAGVGLDEVIALNARSEIALSSDWTAKVPLDGCSAFAWNADGRQFNGQNWDWRAVAVDLLILLEIEPLPETGRPGIKMMTEAGVIGKIGLNEHGVSTMLNALRIPECRFDALPVHLFLRRALEQPSVPAVVDYLGTKCGNRTASTANVVLADPTTAVSIELHPSRPEIIALDADGFVLHTNHLVQLKDEREMFLWPDSLRRLPRLAHLVKAAVAGGQAPSFAAYRAILSDRSDGEKSICRHETERGITTVFSIAVDGAGRRAEVKVGRPDEGGEILVLAF